MAYRTYGPPQQNRIDLIDTNAVARLGAQIVDVQRQSSADSANTLNAAGNLVRSQAAANLSNQQLQIIQREQQDLQAVKAAYGEQFKLVNSKMTLAADAGKIGDAYLIYYGFQYATSPFRKEGETDDSFALQRMKVHSDPKIQELQGHMSSLFLAPVTIDGKPIPFKVARDAAQQNDDVARQLLNTVSDVNKPRFAEKVLNRIWDPDQVRMLTNQESHDYRVKENGISNLMQKYPGMGRTAASKMLDDQAEVAAQIPAIDAQLARANPDMLPEDRRRLAEIQSKEALSESLGNDRAAYYMALDKAKSPTEFYQWNAALKYVNDPERYRDAINALDPTTSKESKQMGLLQIENAEIMQKIGHLKDNVPMTNPTADQFPVHTTFKSSVRELLPNAQELLSKGGIIYKDKDGNTSIKKATPESMRQAKRLLLFNDLLGKMDSVREIANEETRFGKVLATQYQGILNFQRLEQTIRDIKGKYNLTSDQYNEVENRVTSLGWVLGQLEKGEKVNQGTLDSMTKWMKENLNIDLRIKDIDEANKQIIDWNAKMHQNLIEINKLRLSGARSVFDPPVETPAKRYIRENINKNFIQRRNIEDRNSYQKRDTNSYSKQDINSYSKQDRTASNTNNIIRQELPAPSANPSTQQ